LGKGLKMDTKNGVSLVSRKVAISQISISKIQEKSFSVMAVQLINPTTFSELLSEKYLHILAFIEPIFLNEKLELMAGFNTFFAYKSRLKNSVKVPVKIVKQNDEAISLISLYLASNLVQKKAAFHSIKENKKVYMPLITDVFPSVKNLSDLQNLLTVSSAQARASAMTNSQFEMAFQVAGVINHE
jgi:hypothetical protein